MYASFLIVIDLDLSGLTTGIISSLYLVNLSS